MKDLKIKRVYDELSKDDGVRILVDRLWPRGIRKEEAHIDYWMKDIAPSTELREWFSHDPEKFKEFSKRYITELKDDSDDIKKIKELLKSHNVTLLYAAKDTTNNQAVVLQKYLQKN